MPLTTDMFDYDLPERLIAQHPSPKRGEDRMLVVDRGSEDFRIEPFSAIVKYFRPGDAMIYNDTKVLKARMFGVKRSDGHARFEILLIAPVPETVNHWFALLKPGKRAVPGTVIDITGRDSGVPVGCASVIGPGGDGAYEIDLGDSDVEELFRLAGHVPLPPYVKHGDTPVDAERYQTVYARMPGAVAAPTAGLHFTDAVLAEIAALGVRSAPVTLHVGPGTFRPVTVSNPDEHVMHTEYCEVSPETAELIRSVRRGGGRVLAVGTTTVRTLESFASDDPGPVSSGRMSTGIFLRPPYRPRVCDLLLTNFHMPRSTLMMLVSCFIPREKLLRAYDFAIRHEMRFASYGDAMLIL